MNARPSLAARLLIAAALLTTAATCSGCVETIASLFEPHDRHAREAYWQQFSTEDRPLQYQVPSWH